jgi:hypothetical protein
MGIGLGLGLALGLGSHQLAVEGLGDDDVGGYIGGGQLVRPDLAAEG